MKRTIPLNIHLIKVNNKNSRKMCEIKVNNKDIQRRHSRRFEVFIVNLEHIWHLSLVFILLTLSM